MTLLPLDDVTVIDLSHAGSPVRSRRRARRLRRGSSKIEPRAADISARVGSAVLRQRASYFVGLHRNKAERRDRLSSTPRARRFFWKLVEHADVVLGTTGVGVIDKLGLATRRAARANPRIIYCRSRFGQTGRIATRALDLILQAESRP